MRKLIFLCLCLAACNSSTQSKRGNGAYFDLKGFFDNESTRLARTNQPVKKTVSRNGTPETRTVQPDWAKELTLFSESDINKPAWKNSYRVTTSPDGDIVYNALEENLRTRRIIITKRAGTIKRIRIYNRTSNFLYSSVENLTYYPDSLYVINKNQQVRILGKNLYLITGKLK